MSKRFAALAVAPWGLLLLGAGCATYRPFDSVADVREKYAASLGAARAAHLVVPFELPPEAFAEIDRHLKPAGSEERRADDVVDYIFGRVGLKYEQIPTRDAESTRLARRGNCLSFVNLFVALARHVRLSPFYVEVTDYQRWTYRGGLVLSQGHVVAGMVVEGSLKTYDFLPYRPKGYRGFKPIDDVTAAAHFYNNLGAEALMEGDVERARQLVETAVGIAPGFVKGLNNLGVLRMRQGDLAGAEAVYKSGLAIEPDDVALLDNLAQLYLHEGRTADAKPLIDQLTNAKNSNPFFFVLRGEQALASGDTDAALKFMVEALRRDSESPEVHLGLMKVYLAVGDLAKARHHLERALRLDATNQEARRYAEMLGQRGSGAQ